MSERTGGFELLVAASESFAAEVTRAVEATRRPVQAVPVGSASEAIERAGGREIDGAIVADCLDEPVALVEQLAGPEGCPVVFLSGDGTGSAVVEQAIDAGAIDVFPRTTAETQYELVVGRVLPGGRGAGQARRDREYEQIFNSVNDAVVVFDPETGAFQEVNDSYLDLLGYDDIARIRELGIDGLSADREEFTGERGKALIREVSETGEPVTVDWLAETADGTEVWLECTLAPAEIGGERRVVSIQRDVTERRDLERTYQNLFESVSDGLVVHDPETGDILEVNERYCEMTGYERSELLGESISFFLADTPEYTQEGAMERIRKAREEGPQLFEFRGQRKDGTEFVAETNLRTIELRGRERVLASIRDITERKRREREYERIFHGVNDTITIHDPETAELQEVNQTFCDLLGYDRDEILEMGIEGYTPADEGFSMADAEEFVRDVVESGEPRQTEWAVETRDGEIRWLDVKGTTVDTGDELQYVSISRDVTERRRREREYERIFHGVNDSIVIQDPETAEPLDVNETFLERLGYEDVDEVREQGLAGLSATEAGFTKARAQKLCQRVIETGEPEVVEWQQRTRDGETRWIEATVDSAVIRGENRILSMQRDITERKRRERAIRALQTATERLQTAKTSEEVARIAVEAASELFDLPVGVCWFYDAAVDRLARTAATDRARTGEFASELSPDHYEYEVFQDGQVTEYVPGDRTDDRLETGVLLPLDEYGLIAAATQEEARIDEGVVDVARALADHVTTALDRIERAREVRESERRFRLIADRIEEVIYLAEPDFSEVLYANPAYESIWGRPVEELYDDPQAFLAAVDPRDRERVETKFRAMLEEAASGDPDDAYEFECRIRKPSGELRWIEANGYAVELPGEKRRFVGIVREITNRKHREQRLKVFNRILRHNLRNRLEVIRSHAEVLADEVAEGHADRITSAVDELAGIASRARQADRMMSTEDDTGETDIAEAVRTTMEELCSENPALEVNETLPSSARVTTNPTAFQAAVRSALENAVEYAESTVTVSLQQDVDESLVIIEDDGPGIPEAELAPIEDGTETSLQHSRGLGLWQLRWSVDKFGGDLSFDTAGGTTVRITVPDLSAQ